MWPEANWIPWLAQGFHVWMVPEIENMTSYSQVLCLSHSAKMIHTYIIKHIGGLLHDGPR
jgi:hypothetical protein